MEYSGSGNMNGQYCIVEFLPERGIGIVASSWLLCAEDNILKCRYPPQTYSHSQRRKAVKQCLNPDNTWPVYECVTRFFTDDYEKAIAKEIQAVEQSNLESETDAVSVRPKRKRIKKKRFSDENFDKESSTDSDDAVLTKLQTTTCGDTVPVKPPVPPRAPNINFWENHDHASIAGGSAGLSSEMGHLVRQSMLLSEIGNSQVCSTPRTSMVLNEMGNSIWDGYRHRSFQSSNIARQIVNSYPTEAIHQSSSISQMASSDIYRSIFQCLEEVKSNQHEILTRLNHLNTKMNLVIPDQAGITSSDDITFPIVTLEQFDRTELSIADPQKKRLLIRKMATIGGVNAKECTRRILRHVLADNCAKQFNWRGTGKRSFKTTSLCSAIFSAVRLNPLTSAATDVEMEISVKEWLKHAAVRDGDRMVREQRKRNAATATCLSSNE